MPSIRPSPSASPGSHPTSARRDRAAGSRAVRRARGLGQDDDAGRAGGLAGGRRRGPGLDLRRRVQQARGRGADGAAGRGAGAAGRGRRRRAGPDVPRPGAGDPPRRGRAPWSRSWTGTRCCATCSRGSRRADRGRLDLAFSRLKLDLRVTADEVARGSGARAGRPRVHRLRGRRPGVGRARLRRPAWCAPSTRLRADARLLARWRSRAAGCWWTRRRTWTEPSWSWRCCWPRPRTTSSWSATTTRRCTLATGRRAARPRAGRLAAGPAAGGPRDELPVPAAGRRPRRAARRAQPRAVREADPGRARGGRAARPRPRCGRRCRCASGGRWRTWPADGSTRAVLARTNRELLVAVVAALDLGIPFRAPDLPLAIEDPRLDGLLDRAEAGTGTGRPGAPTARVPSPPSAGSGQRCAPRRRCRHPTTRTRRRRATS